MRGLLLFLAARRDRGRGSRCSHAINVGYVLFVARRPIGLELSLNRRFSLLAVAAFALAYAVARFLAARLGRLPAEVRAHRKAQQIARARRSRTLRWSGAARRDASAARAQPPRRRSRIPHSSGLAALIAARAAMETREFDAAEGFLSRPDAQVPALAGARMMLEAEIALRARP